MVTLFGKLALVGAMAIGTFFADSIILPASGNCPYRDEYNCCVYQCMHDDSTGCQRRARCCENLCA